MKIKESKRTLSKLQQAYADFFFAKLDEFGVDTPAALDDDKKTEFFNSIKKDWKTEKVELAKQGIKSISEDIMLQEKAMIAEFVIQRKVKIGKLLREVIRKPMLTESFKNNDVASFFKYIKSSTGDLPYKMNNVAWSEIPPDAASVMPTTDATKLINDARYIIFWASATKKTAKWVRATYSKYGSRRDNNKYVWPGLVAISRKRDFVETTPGAQEPYAKIQNYNKPDGITAVKQLLDLADVALVIDYEKLSSLYNSGPQRKERASMRNALASLKPEQVKNANLNRYQHALKIKATAKELVQYDNMVKAVMTKYVDFIKTLIPDSESVADVEKFSRVVASMQKSITYLLASYEHLRENSSEWGWRLKIYSDSVREYAAEANALLDNAIKQESGS